MIAVSNTSMILKTFVSSKKHFEASQSLYSSVLDHE